MSDKKKELIFKYLFNDSYNPTYVNGAHGGVTPRGELIINFYLERQPLPQSINHEINTNGTIGKETAIEPSDMTNSLVRFVSSGVVLSHQSAKDIHMWLGEKLKELEAIEEAKARLSAESNADKSRFTH